MSVGTFLFDAKEPYPKAFISKEEFTFNQTAITHVKESTSSHLIVSEVFFPADERSYQINEFSRFEYSRMNQTK